VTLQKTIKDLPAVVCRFAIFKAEGWRGGEVSRARTEGSTMEVRSDSIPQPARRFPFDRCSVVVGGVCCFFAVLAFLAGCSSAPPRDGAVAGTVWTWQGERRISEFVEVPAGVTLRLAPGTTLRFAFVDRDGDGVGDAGLHVLGRIEAMGTPAAPIILTSAEGAPQPGDWQGLVFDNSAGNVFADCRFEYAQHALHAHFSSARLEHCRLERNIEGTRLGNSRFAIERCLVRGNASKGLNFFGCSNAIRHNLITGNADGVFLFEADADSVVEANNIVGNKRYDVRLGDFYRGGKRLGANWFGTVDPAAIRERVFDGKDDPALGTLEFTAASAPFITGWEGEP
jgi:hypothetical protein